MTADTVMVTVAVADVLLCCSASVSVYKVCDLASKLTQAGHRVRTVLTENAAKLVSPQLFEAVTGEPAFVSEWGDARRSAMDHIDLSRFAEIVVIAPCSANLAARLAHGCMALRSAQRHLHCAWPWCMNPEALLQAASEVEPMRGHGLEVTR